MAPIWQEIFRPRIFSLTYFSSLYRNSSVAFCCPPVIVRHAHHVQNVFMRHGEGVLRHARHTRVAIQVFAKVTAGAACLACPATTLIQPSPAIVFTPSQSALPTDYTPLPDALIPGLGGSGMPPAWSAGAGFAPEEEVPSVPPEMGAFASARRFIPEDNSLFSTALLPGASVPGVLVVDTGAGTVTTGNSSLTEPRGVWVLGIGIIALVGLGVSAPRRQKIIRCPHPAASSWQWSGRSPVPDRPRCRETTGAAPAWP